MSVPAAQGITVNSLHRMREQGEKIACLTAYDASFANLLDQAGIDVILVGDSLGMVIQGNNSTVSVTMEDMLYHTQCVSKMVRRAMLISDMPFMSYSNIDSALANATLLMQEAGAHMVKLEATERQTEIVSELSACGIPVCAHLGLRPQFVHKLGGYQTQASDNESATALLNTSVALEQAGADLLLVECIPAQLASEITRTVSIPVIGIGAGKDTDGQILVVQDILGISPATPPSFVQNFFTLVPSAMAARTSEVLFSAEKKRSIFSISAGNDCAACIKSDLIALAVLGSVPGALPKPRSTRSGYNLARVPNCSAITKGEWFGNIIPPEPTLIFSVFSAIYPINKDVALLPTCSIL